MLQQAVTPGQLYHFKVGVADAGDGIFDSGVLMKIKSFYGYASMPIANFLTSINGNMVTFNNTTNWAKYFVWDFGDGSTDSVFANNTSITHVYSNNGSYEVKLEAHNYYQVNTTLQNIQIGNAQGIVVEKGNTFEFIPSGAENTYQLNISLNQPQDVSILITDVSGKPVRTMLMKAQKEISHTFQLSGMAKGIYILQVNSRESSFVRKVINK
jgi:PKD repeat protein